MVMTLRTRVRPVRRSSSSEWEEEVVSGKKKIRKISKPKQKSRKRIALSESEKENGSTVSGYETIREQRIRENRERMEKLGIISLSSQVFNTKRRPSKNRPKKKRNPPILLPRPPRSYESRRRSDRLKDVARTNYFETERSLKEMGISIPVGWKPEVYTDEDGKLLGDCEEKWELEVDGIGEDGDLLYDPVNGTSCHQCRYKTLRKHTYCNNCRSGRGMLCGDCLYTRYGENVLEAAHNPKWLCPACRGICNCSRCRREKGWLPITTQYAKVMKLGFKSVAHYLILNRRAGNIQKKSEKGTVIVDVTEEKSASPYYICSDTSAEWSEYDSDDSNDDNLKDGSKNMEQSVEKHLGIVEPKAVNEVADVTDKNEVLQERNS